MSILERRTVSVGGRIHATRFDRRSQTGRRRWSMDAPRDMGRESRKGSRWQGAGDPTAGHGRGVRDENRNPCHLLARRTVMQRSRRLGFSLVELLVVIGL